MSFAIPDATPVASVDLVLDPGRRVIARDATGHFHFATVRPASSKVLTSEQSFSLDGALGLAAAVLAGNEGAMTAPNTVRTLAATVAVFGLGIGTGEGA